MSIRNHNQQAMLPLRGSSDKAEHVRGRVQQPLHPAEKRHRTELSEGMF